MKKKKQEHIVLKLISGDEVIGLIKSQTQTAITLDDPFLVITHVTDTGLAAVYLKRYMTLSTDYSISLLKRNVLASYTPSESLVQYYSVTSEYYTKVADEYLLKTVDSVTDSIKGTIDRYTSQPAKRRYTESRYSESKDTIDEWLDSIKKNKANPGTKH
jgi:hypothetical protein